MQLRDASHLTEIAVDQVLDNPTLDRDLGGSLVPQIRGYVSETICSIARASVANLEYVYRDMRQLILKTDTNVDSVLDSGFVVGGLLIYWLFV